MALFFFPFFLSWRVVVVWQKIDQRSEGPEERERETSMTGPSEGLKWIAHRV